jgi:hypothetical protein
MIVEDFRESAEPGNEAELVSFLMRRYGSGVNSFWLSHDKYPAMSILVNGDLSSLIYFPHKRHPGFRSVGRYKNLKPGGTTVFYLDSINQQQPMINDSIVSFETSLKVAREFYNSNVLPPSIEWFEL